MESIYTRRSIRRYTDKPVEKEKIDKILRAAMQAPSAWNQQAWEFLVIENKETLQKLSKINPYASSVAVSPVSIIVMGNEDDMRDASKWQQDLGAATQNILLEVTEQGLGSVWIGVAPSKQQMQVVSEMFKLPSNIHPFAIVSIGYPEQGQGNKYVDRYDETKVHYEKF